MRRRGDHGGVNRLMLDRFGLDPEILHLNHGAFGVAPIAVRRAAEAWRDRAERNPHRFNGRELPGLIAGARAEAAGFVGVSAESVGLVRNVSEGFSAVLGSLDPTAGDEIVISEHGYGAVRIAAEHWAARHGGTVRVAGFPLGAEDDLIVSAYAAACGPRTRLVVVDQITSPTATVLPVAGIAAAVSAPVLVDAAHVPGMLPTDIERLGVAYWVGNLHKWGYTPRGSALLWTRADLRDRTWPGVLSWQLTDGYAAGFDYPGTWDYAGWLAIGDGLAFWREIGGWEQVDRRAALLSDAQKRTADALGTALDGLPVVAAPTLRLVRLPAALASSAAAARALSDRLSSEYAIEVPVTRHGGESFLRMAAAPYNTAEDYDRLTEAVSGIARG
jgi:isopenicillin-N epimerase